MVGMPDTIMPRPVAPKPQTIASKGAAAMLHKPGHNDETAGYLVTSNTKTLLKKHLAETGGQVRPPSLGSWVRSGAVAVGGWSQWTR